MRLQKARFHFVGIGGIGMCGLAELLFYMGAQVTGSDQGENANTERLKSLGIQVFKGHRADHVGEVDVVVYTSAANMQNPELAAAREKGVPVIPRAEALAEIMRLKRGLAIAGTHGKTTTTSMASTIFLEAKSSPTIMIGGRLDLIQSTALLGEGEWMIAEADESDGSFSKLSPEIAIITNIDSDHLDHYGSFENLKKAFLDFALKVPFYGALIACGDDPHVLELFQNYPKRKFFYGFQDHNDFVISGQAGKFELKQNGKSLGRFQLQFPGRHYALNAAAALIGGLVAGISFETASAGLARFSGVDRRFQLKGEAGGISVFDDYGHHPTEVRATLQAFKEKYPDRRFVVFFQPHRFSRTEICWKEFIQCFRESDVLLLTDIYPAGEKPIANVTSERLLREVQHSDAHYLARSESLGSKIRQMLKPGDVFLTLGAGDGWKIGMEILESLQRGK